MSVPAPWRVILLSQVLNVVEGLYELLRGLGHEPVALISARRFRSHEGAIPPGVLERFGQLAAGAPTELDVLIPHDSEALARLVRAYEPDLVLCSIFPWLLPPEAIEAPRLGAINIHPSLLPKYRGPAPIHAAIRNGDAEMGMTVHRMSTAYDTGAILAQARVPLDPEETPDSLFPKLDTALRNVVPRAFERIAAGDPGDFQDEEQASWAGFFEPEFARIDWSRPAREIHNQVRTWAFPGPFDPRGGPLGEVDGEVVRVLRTRLEPGDGTRIEAGDGPIWVVETARVEG
jgi:methionyl-tRNA formyltransferase